MLAKSGEIHPPPLMLPAPQFLAIARAVASLAHGLRQVLARPRIWSVRTLGRIRAPITDGMAFYQLIVKPTAGGEKFSVDAQPSMTVAELKGQVQSKSQVPPEEQRLIYKGQVLKDERTMDSYGEAGHRCLAC